LKSTVAIAYEHARRVAAVVRDCDVEIAVVVYVSDGHRTRTAAHRVGDLRLKSTVAVPKEHAHVVVTSVCHDQVKLVVAIEIAHSDG
jgi:hypothetical protein